MTSLATTEPLVDAPTPATMATRGRRGGKRPRSPALDEVVQSSAARLTRGKRRESNATAPTPATRGRRNTTRGRDASGADEDEEPLEVVRGGSTVNAYEMTNMVKSELVAEFERRGEKLIELERETIELRQKTANAESLHAAVKAEVETLRELKSEHEKSKNAMRDELAEERQANMLALEREVERACDAESRAKTLALELAQVKEERVKLEASIDRERANDSAEEAAEILDLSEKTAELEYAVAEHLDEISNLKRENMSLKTSLQRTEAERDEATERVEQSEEAVRSCEGLVAVAEASMIEMRKELDAATSMSPTQTTPEIEELRATNKVLQEELRIATKEAAEVKTLRRKSEFAATCEERAMAAEARALRAEASVIETSSLQTRLSKLEYLENDWASVIERVTGDVKLPSDLVQRVITLESRLTAQAGDKGKMMSDLAEAQMNETTAARRASEAEEKSQSAETRASEATGALAKAERQKSLMKNEMESLQRLVKSYEDEANVAAAKNSNKEKVELERRCKDLEKAKDAATKKISSLEKAKDAATSKVSALEKELNETKTRAQAAEQAAQEAATKREETPETDARVQVLERERDELVQRLKRAAASAVPDPQATKVLHFKSNPVAAARRSHMEKELESLRSEANGLREALSKLKDGSGTSANEADMTILKRKVEDLQKREQRLMTVFKRQISAFREACHKIFGYKIEMTEGQDGGATFSLLSDFAVKPTDTFAFKYDEKASTVTLKPTTFVDTPEVKRSAETFIDRLECIPAFVANHTLEAFNNSDATA